MQERLAALSHHTDPTSVSLLAQAYRADGQIEKARTTATEGLGLLPPISPVPLLSVQGAIGAHCVKGGSCALTLALSH